MTSFGSYEVVEELHRTPFGYVCSACRAGAPPDGGAAEFVLKVYEAPDTDGDGAPGPDAPGCEHFMARARLQQKLSQADARHWARIHDLGDSRDKPFYATDYYPRSAQKLILGRVILGPAALHEIITSIVHGLRELHEICGQSHGCLKPTNVLIGGAGEVSGAKIVLADPACAPPAVETADGGDLHALGALIYQLVLHRPFHTTAWPIADSEEWSSLGRFAHGWRELCNALLNPEPGQRPDAAALDRSLAALAPHGISVKHIAHIPTSAARKAPVKKIAVSIVVLALVAAGGGAFVYLKQSSAYSAVHEARSKWIDALWKDKKALGRYASFGTPVMQQSDWDALQLPTRPISVADFSVAALRQAQNAQATAHQVHQRLLDIYEKTAQPLNELQQSYDHDGYTQAATYLRSTLSSPPPDDAHLSAAIDARIALADKLKSDRPGLSPASAATLDRFTHSGDKDFQGFADTLRAAFRRDCVLTATGWSGAPEVDKLTQQVASVADWPAAYDADRLNREEKLDPNHLRIEEIKRWLAVVNQYAWVSPTGQQRAAQQARAAQLATAADHARTELLRFLPATSPEVQSLDQDRAAIAKQIDALSATRFVRKDLPAGWDLPAKKLDEQIASLASRHQYQPGDLAKWFATLQAEHFNSQAARNAWAQWMKGRSPANIDAAWKEHTTALAKTLFDLEGNTFLIPDALNVEPWTTPVRQRADQSIAEAIGRIAPGATALTADQINPIKKDFESWCNEVAKLKQEQLHLQRTLINTVTLEMHDRNWSAASDKAFWASQVAIGPFAAVMKPELDRMAAIRGILNETDKDKVLEKARSSNRAEVILAVWARLAALKARPFPGPLTPAGIQAWTDLLMKVKTASGKLAPVARDAMEKQVAASGQRMWFEAVDADSAELLDAAQSAAATLGLSPERKGLATLRQFDLALCDAIRSDNPENRGVLEKQISALPEWDRLALQQLAPGSDLAQAAISHRGYLWIAGEDERKQKWQKPPVNPAEQLAKANALLEDYQPRAAMAALEGLSGSETDVLRKQIEELEQAAPGQLRQGNSYFANHRYPLAFREFQQAARGGSDEAMLHLGRMYRDGTGVPRNRNLELKFYRLAAAGGNVDAMGELAVTYFSYPQWPLEASAPEVEGWFKTAADSGNVDAMAGLAQIAIQKHDSEEASRRLTAADAHDPDKKHWHLASLMRQLARLYEAKGAADARKWYQAAADRGDTEAQAWLRR